MGLLDFFTGVGADYEQTSGEELLQKISDQGSKNLSIIDVRSAGEYSSGHIRNARNINVMSSDFGSKVEGLDKSKTYYIVCASGNRSKTACGIMKKKGFEKVVNVRGGMMSWSGPVV